VANILPAGSVNEGYRPGDLDRVGGLRATLFLSATISPSA
jgi:hypothetical protein